MIDWPHEVSGTLQENYGPKQGLDDQHIYSQRASLFVSSVAFAQNQRDEIRDLGDVAGGIQAEPGTHQQTFVSVPCHGSNVGPMGTLRQGNGNETGGVPFVFTERTREGVPQIELQADVAYAMTNPGGGGRSQCRMLMDQRMAVRRLTPRECERLQGFPDDWTEGFSDSARYRMLGNAVAVPVARWIAERIVASPLAQCQTHQQIHDAVQTLTEDELRQLRPAVLAAAERVARLIREERKDGA